MLLLAAAEIISTRVIGMVKVEAMEMEMIVIIKLISECTLRILDSFLIFLLLWYIIFLLLFLLIMNLLQVLILYKLKDFGQKR